MLLRHDAAIVRRQWSYLSSCQAGSDRLTSRYILIAVAWSRLIITASSSLRMRVGTAYGFQGARSRPSRLPLLDGRGYNGATIRSLPSDQRISLTCITVSLV